MDDSMEASMFEMDSSDFEPAAKVVSHMLGDPSRASVANFAYS